MTQMASLAALLVLAVAMLASGAAGVRVSLTRIHSGPGVSASQFVRDAVRRDMRRHIGRELAASNVTVSAPTRKDLPLGGGYLMTLAIGTPPLSYPAIVDTGSDLIWTQCAPCGGDCFQQPTPLYDPSSSSTFSILPCDSPLSICAGAAATPPQPGCNCTYTQWYGIGWVTVVQGSETFTFGSSPAGLATTVPGIAFGCSDSSSHDYNASAGIVGLGRGSLSLVSQLGAGKFSYCLTPSQDTNSTSTLLIGESAAVLNDTGVQSTPFVASPSVAPMSTFYYLNLTGISIGATALPIPPDAFALNADGTGGLIIDSGTTYTQLVDEAYQQVRAAIVSLVTTLTPTDGLDPLCFELPPETSAPPAMPSMTLHFDGADMVLAAESYMLLDGDLWCLAMGNQTDRGRSALGNYQQQNMHILYDIGQETLSFAPADCTTL